MLRQPSPLPASDAIISLTGQPQPETSSGRAESEPGLIGSDALSLSAGFNLSGPAMAALPSSMEFGQRQASGPPAAAAGMDLPNGHRPAAAAAAVPAGGSPDAGSRSDGAGVKDGRARNAPMGRPMGRPASMQPAALIRAAREKAAAAAAAAAPPQAAAQADTPTPFTTSQPPHTDQQQQPAGPLGPQMGDLSIQQPTPFGHPSQQVEHAPSGPDPASSASMGLDGHTEPVEPNKQPSFPTQHEEYSIGVELAGGGESEGISLTGNTGTADPLQQTVRHSSTPQLGGTEALRGSDGSATDANPDGTATTAAAGAASQGLEQGGSVPGPAPPAGSPGEGNAAQPRVPGPRPPPGAPPPRPPPPRMLPFLLCSLLSLQSGAFQPPVSYPCMLGKDTHLDPAPEGAQAWLPCHQKELAVKVTLRSLGFGPGTWQTRVSVCPACRSTKCSCICKFCCLSSLLSHGHIESVLNCSTTVSTRIASALLDIAMLLPVKQLFQKRGRLGREVIASAVMCRPTLWWGPAVWAPTHDANDEWSANAPLAHVHARPRLPHGLPTRSHDAHAHAAGPAAPPPLPRLQSRLKRCLGYLVSWSITSTPAVHAVWWCLHGFVRWNSLCLASLCRHGHAHLPCRHLRTLLLFTSCVWSLI